MMCGLNLSIYNIANAVASIIEYTALTWQPLESFRRSQLQSFLRLTGVNFLLNDDLLIMLTCNYKKYFKNTY